MENHKRYDTISFGVFLLFVGTLALLSNNNLISWSLLLDFFLRYWPVFVILAGIKIIGNAHIGRLFGIVIDVLFFIAVVFGLLYAKDKLFPMSQTIKQEIATVSIPFSEYPVAKSAEYTLKFGAADFTVDDNTSDQYLSMTGPKEFSVLPTLTDSQVLQIQTLNQPIDRFYRFSNFQQTNKYAVSLGVTELDSTMEITTGASNGNVVLDEVKLNTLTSKVGAGDLTVTLSNNSVPKMIDASVGAGKTTIRIVGKKNIKVTYSVGAGSLKLKSISQNFEKEFGGIGSNGVYEMSPNADVEFNVNVGAGAVEILLD